MLNRLVLAIIIFIQNIQLKSAKYSMKSLKSLTKFSSRMRMKNYNLEEKLEKFKANNHDIIRIFTDQ